MADDAGSVDSFDIEPTPVVLHMETINDRLLLTQPKTEPMELAETQPPTTSGVNFSMVAAHGDSQPPNASATIKQSASPPTEVTPQKRPRLEISLRKMRTFVFFDLETTGLFPQQNLEETPLIESTDATLRLQKLIAMTQRLDQYPHITEMSMVAVPRELFMEAIQKMNAKDEENKSQGGDGSSSLAIRVAANIHTRQINPELNENQWSAYDMLRHRLGPAVSLNSRMDLQFKQTFGVEWQGVRLFLDNLPKPICIVAHNGIRFDYRVLYGELQRNGIRNAFPLDTYFLDSLHGFQSIDQLHQRDMQKLVKQVDWKTIAEQVHLSRTEAVENIPAAVREQAEQAHPEERDMFDDTVRGGGGHGGLTQIRGAPSSERTPERPPPSRGTASEPAKLAARRDLFSSASGTSSTSAPLREGHPLLYMTTEKWSPAKRRRMDPHHFMLSSSNGWEYNAHAAERHLKTKGTYSLVDIYKKMLNDTFNAHQAQDDCIALMQVCIAYGEDFLQYADRMAAEFPF